MSRQTIEHVCVLTSEGIYYQMESTFTRPVNVSLTMANDSLLKQVLSEEDSRLDDSGYVETIRQYLSAYQKKYGYDSVFLVSANTGRYYHFGGLDRVLTRSDPENDWYYQLLDSPDDYDMNVDNDEAASDEITVFVNCKIKSGAEVLGIVGVGVRVDDLQGLLQGYQQQFGVDAYLIDAGGNIEVSSDHTGFENVNLFDAEEYNASVQEQLLSHGQEQGASGFWAGQNGADGKSKYVLTRYLPELGWRLVVEQDTSELVQQLNGQLALTLLIIVGLIAVVMVVISCVMRSFNRRIVALTRSVEQERRSGFEKATEQLFDNIYELDITNNRPANKATEEYFEGLGTPHGASFDEALHCVAQQQVKEEFRQGYINMFKTEHVLQAYQAGIETLQYEFMITTGGDYYWMRVTARIVQWESDGSIHMFAYRQNIDAEKQKEQAMQELAQTDEMTGFLTKTATQRRIETLLSQSPDRLRAFFIFDIDNFKTANDQFGHAFGDGVIREFTQILRAHFPGSNVLGRIGGDEFAAFVQIPNRAWAENKAQELLSSIYRLHIDEGRCWQIAASIGVALSPSDGAEYATLYKKADQALYRTKARGKNGVSFAGIADDNMLPL